ncbi:helix-turn-helix domain-containing protein [Aequitasia blattaphilus]|uniref:Helix-turn-helix transcriptional regulator n=1 Tax=Aequitasia blattaphilus TaxID=2949332 RepID=A0ABT1ED07_9FIRM|nr:helix-turn-helix transcriptional regulator [Aequitasia blattaphilus]MCP1103668.1 helix-turn-helix transcriptional regulator [Aequitasia blattaphilus]MCR8616308.1 helix-turn-helix transcriptional regulator [Aequitasia blattaphilus]
MFITSWTTCFVAYPELEIPRSNVNRYCRNEFQRLDANLICKLCNYLDCEVGELMVYVKE